MSNHSIAEPVPSPLADARCEVRARDQVVHYRRVGAGPALLLLHSPEESEAIWPEVVALLGTGRRLIVPDAPAADTDVEAWLSALLDGLGMSSVTVVAADSFCIAALERTLLDPDRIDRIVLVCRGRGSEAAVTGVVYSEPHLANVPILVVRRDRPASEILPVVAKFLGREDGAPVA
jgi:pimeloyl-ACP methyl ester carboxylesterase